MNELTDNFKINLNQNLWGVVFSLSSLGSAEYFGLKILLIFSIFLSLIMTISIIFTTISYTKNYCDNKSK